MMTASARLNLVLIASLALILQAATSDPPSPYTTFVHRLAACAAVPAGSDGHSNASCLTSMADILSLLQQFMQWPPPNFTAAPGAYIDQVWFRPRSECNCARSLAHHCPLYLNANLHWQSSAVNADNGVSGARGQRSLPLEIPTAKGTV